MAKHKIAVESGLKRGDYRALTYWNLFGKNPKFLLAFGIIFVVGALCMLLAGGSMAIFAVGAILAACPVLLLGMTEFNILNVARKGNIEVRTTAHYTVDDMGITARSAATPVPLAYNWRNLSGVYENSRFYIFFINKVQMMTIRKTDLSPADRKVMLELIYTHLDANRIHVVK